MGTSGGAHWAPRWTKGTAALTLAFVLCLIAPASVLATPTYVFEPQLSLTGNCSTAPVDLVPDPGCPEGTHPPGGTFQSHSVATDSYGDIYVANNPASEGKPRIDVFDSEGFFLTEFEDPVGPESIAVDSEGNLYVFERVVGGERMVRRFTPSVYEPLEGKIEYAKAPVVLVDESTHTLFNLAPWTSVAVESGTDRLLVNNGENLAIFSSAKEENKLLDKEILDVPEGSASALSQSTMTAVDVSHRKIYVSDKITVKSSEKSIVRVFNLDSPHEELEVIDGSTTPKGEFVTGEANLRIAVNDATGEVFVGDPSQKKVYQFEEDGTYLATIEHSFNFAALGQMFLDRGSLSPNIGYLFVPSLDGKTGHVYAFEPNEECAPSVEGISAEGVTETEAVLHATLNPCGLPTQYHLEYISQQQYEEEGESFANATLAGEGTLPKGGESVHVSASALGLSPGTAYRFRALAENTKGVDEREGTFTTFPPTEPPPSCPNDALRTGNSALLPDCRAYELVTPPSTNGLPPVGVGFTGVYFPTLEASPDGSRVSFLIEGGAIPGQEAAGAFNGDPYLATRGLEGWTSKSAGPTGKEAIGPNPGGVSPDQNYSFWEDIKAPATYVRYPDGHSELIGRGSLGEDPRAIGALITENATHIIFQTTKFGGSVAQQLEPNAPPTGTEAVYDRPAEGPTHVVSLLPGDETPKEGEDASFLGASEEGEGIAFEIGGAIYLRLHNEETFEAAGPGTAFAGVAAQGTRVFYLEGGDLFAFDAEEEKAIPFTSSGDVTLVNVASGGTSAYFVSPSVLTSEPNPEGEKAEGGAENLYLSEEGAISFVGVVTGRDVEGGHRSDGQVGGLGLWTEALKLGKPAKDPSRTTPTGATLLFESRADLTGFESEGFAQVYRYDATEGRLDCLSCNPTETPPSDDASLQSLAQSQPSLIPASSYARIPNQSPDGQRAFFQTAEPLVIGDTDELLDVYEWEEKGVGSCEMEGGCVYLISGGQSSSPDYLFGMSQSGDDVFFRTSDVLLPRDLESTLSIYDARVGGGYSESEPICREEACCEGETCRPLGSAPELPQPTTPIVGGDGNVPPEKKCPKGKHKVKRHGKEVCVKKHHKKKHHHRRASNEKRGGAR